MKAVLNAIIRKHSIKYIYLLNNQIELPKIYRLIFSSLLFRTATEMEKLNYGGFFFLENQLK